MATTLIDTGTGTDTGAGAGAGTGGTGTADDAAAKAAADKAASDTATAQGAEKAAAEKKAADDAAAAAAAAKAAVPEKYDLKLPAESTVDKAVVERTAARARELGLSNEHAQKTLDFVHQEVSSAVKAATEATLAAHAPGGAKWEENVKEWNAAALADKELGGNKPEQLTANAKLAQQVVAKFGDKESIEFMEKNPLGSHPALLRMLVRIAKASSEGTLVTSGAQAAEKKSIGERWYGNEAKAE
jgi:hypothetical protein